MPADVIPKVVANVFLSERSFLVLPLLPSEERSVQAFEAHLRAWLDAGSSWQLIVPGGPFWTEEELAAWRAALRSPLSAVFLLVWRVSCAMAGLQLVVTRLFRRVSFGIDSHRGIR